MSGRGKDLFGVGCAVIAASIWIGIAVSDSGDDGSHAIPADTAVARETDAQDPLQGEFEAAWNGLDLETRDSYCWALNSMEPDELAAFSSELTGGDPADWNRVTEMIKQKCSEG